MLPWLFASPALAADVPTDAASKQAYAALKPVVSPVEWETADRAIDRSRLRAVDPELGRRADAMPLPVLLPADPELARSARFWHGSGWVVVELSDGAMNIVIHASNHGSVLPAPPAPVSFTSTMVDGIHTLAFTRFGVHYALDVTCPTPTPCLSDAAARELWNGLEAIGGRP